MEKKKRESQIGNEQAEKGFFTIGLFLKKIRKSLAFNFLNPIYEQKLFFLK